MALTNAERQRKFRANRDDLVRRQNYLTSERQRYQKDKDRGVRASTKLLSEREKRILRRKWKKEKKVLRAKQKKIEELITPPMSPVSDIGEPSRQRKQSTKKIKWDQAKCYRENKALRLELEKMKKRSEMYRKRYLRNQKKAGKHDTPRSKTRRIIRNISNKTVKRTLLFQTALMEQMRFWYKSKKSAKKHLAEMISSGAILKKYKFLSQASSKFGLRIQKRQRAEHTYLSLRECQRVRNFFERDDISYVKTGKKQTVTYKKEKKQRRILKETLRNVYLKYISQNSIEIGFSTFCRLRPFWVVFPRPSDRSTCLCKLCENTQFMATALKKAAVIENDNLNVLTCRLVCSEDSKTCMYAQCEVCKDTRLSYDRKKNDDMVQCSQWVSKKEKRTMKMNKKNIEKEVVLTVKETRTFSVCDLAEQLERQLERYKRHSFNIKHQFMFFKQQRENLQANECVIHIDFSENYVCKLGTEIQSMHFGASKKQLSLHTGVYYCQQENGPQTFCTVSENLDHSPGAVWAHLQPILDHIKWKYPAVDTLQFFSDGPTSQYRQKGNFYLLSQKPYDIGFKCVTWNFFEAGHGKGTPDAVGGAIKRRADTKVKYGQDITTAADFIKATEGSEIKTILVSDTDIIKGLQELKKLNLKPVEGTMRLHQVCWLGTPGVVFHRDHSCWCHKPTECTNHKLTEAKLIKDTRKQASKRSLSPEKSKIKKVPRTEAVAEPDPFDRYLKELKPCKTVKMLKRKCKEISANIGEIEKGRSLTLPYPGLDVDINSVDIYPDDVNDGRTLYPCAVKADGNCLPSTGSVFAYGTIERTAEMRIRILVELCENEHLYLDKDFLQTGQSSSNAKNWPYIYAQYSDLYVQGTHLTDKLVRDIIHLETLKIRLNSTFMGMWQIHALSSILKTPIFSVYPKLGPSCVRDDIHRLVMPRQMGEESDFPLYVMWTSTRRDMPSSYWMPNHFVPILPVDDVHLLPCNGNTPESAVLPDSVEASASCDQPSPEPDPVEGHDDPDCISASSGTECQLPCDGNTPESAVLPDSVEASASCDQPSPEPDPVEGHDDPDCISAPSGTECQLPCDGNTPESAVLPDSVEASASCDQPSPEPDPVEGHDDPDCISASSGTECQLPCDGNTPESAVLPDSVEASASCDQPSPEPDPVEGHDDPDCISAPSGTACLGKHVIVNYNGRLYVGLTSDADDNEVFVTHMHQVGRGDKNRFYWPKKLKDECWYDLDRVVAIIPAPEPIENSQHFSIDAHIWSTRMTKENLI